MKTRVLTTPTGVPLVMRAVDRFEPAPSKAVSRFRKTSYTSYTDSGGRTDGHGVAKKGKKWNREFPPSYWTTYFASS